MKKLFTFFALVLGLVSCQTEPEGFDVNVGGEQDVNITVSLPESTRAASNQGFDLSTLSTSDYELRYILEIYLKDGDDSKKFREVKYSDATTVSFPVRLAPSREYHFAVCADLVEKDANRAEGADADYYYETSNGLKNITIDVNKWTPNVEARDAFYGKATLTKEQSIANLPTIELTRPFAKVRVVATDIDDITKFGIEPTGAVAEYFTPEMYTSFNAVEGKAFGTPTTKTHTFNYADVDTYNDVTGQLTVFADYVFVPEDGNVQFTLDIKAGTERIKLNNFNTAIPVERNKVTSIVGDVLTEGGNVNITVDGTLEELETITLVDTAASLQEVIAGIEDGGSANIELGGDIDLGDLFGAGILSTRAAATLPIVIAENKTLVLDLNGFKITTPWEDEAAQKHYYAFKNHGSLTIQDSKGNGQIIARGIFNYGTMTLKSGTINACDGNGGYGVRNYEGATFVMNGGSIVTSNEDGDIPGEGYDASPVRVDEGATATFYGGTINNISNFTVAIDNYGETTINGGTFTTIHTTIANSATMTINGGSFTCNGLEGVTAHAFWAAAGTATINGGTFNGKDNYNGFNVCASKGATVNIKGGEFLPVHSGSLYGEGTINVMGGEFFDDPSKFVNDDYTVEANDGKYTVVLKPTVAKIGDAEYTSIQKAVAAAQNGDTVLFVADVEQEDGVIITDKNITIDLNEKTFTVSNGANTNNRNFKVNGSSVVTIKNGTMVAAGNYSSGAYGTLRTEGTANVTLEDVILYNYRGNGLNVKALSGTTVTITDAEVYSQYGGGIEAAGGTIELTDVKVEQKGMYTAPYNSMAISVNGRGTVTVNSGTYSTECITAEEANNQGTSHGPWCAGVLNSGGTLIIKGGTFSNDNFGENALATHARGLLLADTGANIQIEGGTFNAVKAIIDMTNNLGDASRTPSATISGGDFSADPQVSGLYASHLIKVAAGYEVEKENGRWIVRKPKALADFEAAIAKGGNVTLSADITLLESVVIEGKEVVLDLNGKTVTAPLFSAFEVKNGAELTIKNGKVVAYESTVRAIGGKATIESGEYTSTGTALDTPATYRYSLDCREGGELIINGGTFKSNNGMINVGSAVTINGGKFENVVEKSMTRHFAYVSAPLTINDGEFYGKANSSAGGCFFCGAAAGGNIQVNGGKFTSLWTSGSVNRIFEVYFGGTINVTGGMFNTNGGIATFVTENTDEATKAAYPYVAK